MAENESVSHAELMALPPIEMVLCGSHKYDPDGCKGQKLQQSNQKMVSTIKRLIAYLQEENEK